MRKFLIERNIPGAENLTQEEIKAITQTSNKAVADLGEPYHWVQSFVAGDKIYCVHIAESEEVVREHARLGGFPADVVSEVKTIFDSSAAN